MSKRNRIFYTPTKRNRITVNPFRPASVDDVLDSARDRVKAGDVKHGRPYGKGRASTPEILSTASHVLALAARDAGTGTDYWRGSLTAAETGRRVARLFELAGGYRPSASTCAARIGEHLTASERDALPSPYFARGWSGNMLRAALSAVWQGRAPRVER
jgi:hypothetical protein